jgi:hypothetical protein
LKGAIVAVSILDLLVELLARLGTSTFEVVHCLVELGEGGDFMVKEHIQQAWRSGRLA